MARSQWVDNDTMRHVLAALMPENRLAIITSLVTGLRIGDVLGMRVSQVRQGRFTVTEEKTLKRRVVCLPKQLQLKLLGVAGVVYVFEGRTDARKHRTRQAVYKDIKRAAKAFRVSENLTVHTARKIYAVQEYRKDMNLERVRRLLNHSNEAVTMVYALADQIEEKGVSRETKDEKEVHKQQKRRATR